MFNANYASHLWRPLCGALLLVSLITGSVSAQSAQPLSATETVTVDSHAAGRPFPHFWERMFGSGRAILSLRDGYRRDLRDVKRITGLEYIRFHAILHDEVGVYDEDQQGKPLYNFSYVDQIYDGLLENGVRPFVELGFMPAKLASSQKPHAFWYKPFPSPPKSYDKWDELVYRFAKHLVDRYGVDEVARWYFEVWNEPNLDFWTGEPKEATYYELYDHTSRAVKRVNAGLRVGGPATAQAAWVDRFIKHCVATGAPVDFVSTHVYANDLAHDVFGTNEDIPRDRMVARSVKKVYDQVKSSARPDLPIIWSEYNASYKNEVEVTDAPYMGAWLADNIRQCDGMTEMMSYWTFSDVFEEQGVVKTPFYGGYGLIAAGNIPKASYNAFKLLHMLGSERIMIDSTSALATRRADGSLAIAVWNYAPPESAGSRRQVKLAINGLTGRHRLRIHLLDRDHGSTLAVWEAMGRPNNPSRQQLESLRKAAELPAPEERLIPSGKGAVTTLELPAHSLALIEVIE
jgi:xylan 1,4-beta-xylosidase